MLYRKIEKNIENWLKTSKSALLIEGARQVGKTYIIRSTLSTCGVPFFEFNLIENPDVIKIFETSKNNINSFVDYLSFLCGETIEKGSIIFLDEIQQCKEIVTYIKFLVDQNDYKFILSGSLLGVELVNLKSAPVGYLEILKMYPLDLEEFCINQGVPNNILGELRICFEKEKEVPSIIHDKMIEIFKNYLIIGGMPDSVNKFLEEKSLADIEKVHKNLIELYKLDFTKCEENSRLKLMKIYELLPAELSSPNKRFIFSDLENRGRFDRYENSFNWLIDAGVALPTYNISEPRLPLKINMDNSSFKFFMSDVGLLTSCYGSATKHALVVGDNSLNAGAIYENFVAQELAAHGFDLFYFNNRRLGELDFVIEYEEKALPIEVKSGKDYVRHSALNNALKNEVYKIDKAIVLSNYNVSKNGNILYLPIYMTMFIDNPTLDNIKLKKVVF